MSCDDAAEPLAEHVRVDEATAFLRQHADTDGPSTALRLGSLLPAQGQVDEATALFRQRVDISDVAAAHSLIELLVAQVLVDEHRERAEAGNMGAAYTLVELLASNDGSTILATRSTRKRSTQRSA